jgi:hypothetical protein
LLPGGSGYFTCTQNMNLVSNKFKSGGLHEEHAVATWSLGNHLSIRSDTAKPRKTCADVAGRRIFRILTSSNWLHSKRPDSQTRPDKGRPVCPVPNDVFSVLPATFSLGACHLFNIHDHRHIHMHATCSDHLTNVWSLTLWPWSWTFTA